MTKPEDWKKLGEKLDYSFANPRNLFDALTHPSYLKMEKSLNPGKQKSNRVLAYVGEKVIHLFIAEKLYTNYPDASLTELELYHSRLVNEKTLAELARKLELGNLLFMHDGETAMGNRDNDAVLFTAICALCGGMHVDRAGAVFKIGKLLEEKLYKPMMASPEERKYFDPKSLLEELSMEKFHEAPKYKLLDVYLGATKTEFEIGVYIKEVSLARTKSPTKEEAARKAALTALEYTENLTKNIPYALLRQRDITKEIDITIRN